jgi:drug/metabolite transporter (DMT)-like permease
MAIKAGLAYFPPVLFGAIRYDIGGVVMLGYVALTTEQWRPRTASEWRLVGIGAVLLIAAYNGLLFVGQQETTSAAAAVIISLSPVLTTAFARVLLPFERLRPTGVIGLVLGFLGVLILAQPNPANLLAGSVPELLILGAAISFALGSVLTRRSAAPLPVETMEAWSMLGGALVLHVVSLGLGESIGSIHVTPVAFGALGYLAVVSSAFGYLLYFDLLDRLGPIEINLVSYVAPCFAALAGWLALGETVGLPTVIGFLVIVTGFVLIKRSDFRRVFMRNR